MSSQKVAIYSVPRSGSSWLGEIINSSPIVNYSYQPLFSYKFKSRLDEKSSTDEINKFFEEISQSNDSFIKQSEERILGKKPNFQKGNTEIIAYKEVRYINIIENLLQKSEDIKVVGLVRNPLSVLSSWKNAPREFRVDLGWDFNQEWEHALLKNGGRDEEYFGFNKWKESVQIFEKLQRNYSERFYLITYNDLLSNLDSTVENLFTFLNIPMSKQTIEFLESTSIKGVSGTYSVYNGGKNKDDSWKNNLPKNIIEKVVDDCNNLNFSKYLK